MGGRKVFQPATVLTAADVNNYLMDQSVMVFADSTARLAAIPTPTEGMITYLETPGGYESYDGAAWVEFGGGGGGAELLSTTTLSGASTTITGISQDYTDLLVEISKPSNASNAACQIIPKNSTSQTINFRSVMTEANNAGNLNNVYSSGTEIASGNSNASGNTQQFIRAYFRNYTLSDNSLGSYKTVEYSQTLYNNTNGYVRYHGEFFPESAITGGISEITINASNGSWTGGTVKIYGVK